MRLGENAPSHKQKHRVKLSTLSLRPYEKMVRTKSVLAAEKEGLVGQEYNTQGALLWKSEQ